MLPEDVTAANQGPGYDLLMVHADALDAYEVTAEEHSIDDAQAFAFKLATEKMNPHRDVLHQRALRLLQRLPTAERITTDGWQCPSDELAEMENILGELDDELDKVVPSAALFWVAWNPVQLFLTTRTMLYARVYPVRVVGQRTMIDGVSPSRVVRLSDDGEHPVFVWQGTREFYAVSFRYDAEKGYDMPIKLEWLVKP